LTLSAACEVDWQALATFLTGILAVVAAVHVGRKQTKIQERQTRLIENDLKISLLETRTKCVSDMREIYWAWMRYAKLSQEEMHKFYKLMEQAQLMFPLAVSKKLDDLVDATFWSEQHYQRSQIYNDRGEQDLANDRLEKSFAEEDKVMKLMPELLKELVDHTRVDAWE
jgi:hypothetical protein